MPSDREKTESWTAAQLYDSLSNHAPDSHPHHVAAAEIMRRQMVAQDDLARVQKEAADATIATAEYTRLNARYMLYSVIAILVTSGASAIFSFLMWYAPRIPK